jgi:hypothetical protein
MERLANKRKNRKEEELGSGLKKIAENDGNERNAINSLRHEREA